MSSRDYIRHVVSANTSINGQRVGDEVYDPTTNKLYKTVPISGTQVTNSEVLLNGPALATTTLSVGKIFLGANITSNSTSTGTLVVSGGIGVTDSIYAGGVYVNGVPVSVFSGVNMVNDTTTAATYYPMLSLVSDGLLVNANVSNTKLYYTPATGTLNATTFNSLSDREKKTNIQIISNSLNIVENINGVTFDWIENGLPSAGLIAQDVEKYLPQLIANGENGKSINYDGVIGVLVEAIKELSQRVKHLEGE